MASGAIPADKVLKWLAGAVTSLFLGWIIWVSTTLLELKRDTAVLRFSVFGVVVGTPSLIDHPAPHLSLFTLPGLPPLKLSKPSSVNKEKKR